MTAIAKIFNTIFRPVWLTGPIFDKELRVSSRRKRNYALRFLYIFSLILFILLVWMSQVDIEMSGPLSHIQARMSEAGKYIVASIIGFEFLAVQFIAIIMLSTSISDEIYKQTLGVLMTTPINSFQIVMGKLISKLLQLLLLLAISIPLLAIVRVFGGVPWDFILSGMCIILTAVIFAGSLSLFYSISGRKSYAVTLKTLLTLAAIYGLFPVMSFWYLHYRIPNHILFAMIAVTNPFITMYLNVINMLDPNAITLIIARQWQWYWIIHCIIMSILSSCLLVLSFIIVRKKALKQITGQLNIADEKTRKHIKILEHLAGKHRFFHDPAIREVSDKPIIWKEMRDPMIQGGRIYGFIGLAISVLALIITYIVSYREDLLKEDNTHMSYCLIFVIMGLLTNLVMGATTLTSEKESRSWPILLATTLNNRTILTGKTIGVIYRCLPVWAFLFAHLVIFIFVKYMHPVALLHFLLILSWTTLFLTGTGIYFSSLFNRSTSSVVANLFTAFVLWAVLPVVMGMLSDILHNRTYATVGLAINPLIMTAVTALGDGGDVNAMNYISELKYRFPTEGFLSFSVITSILLLNTVIYSAIGGLLAWRAQKRFRKNIFFTR